MSFANSSNVTAQDGTFPDVNGNINNYTAQLGDRGIRELFQGSFPEATYDSQNYFPNSRGSSDTHELAVKEVFDWISGGRTKICWIYGAPGAGKSSVMQDVAARCAHRGILGASFFFNRYSRASSERLVSSIACQLTVTKPEKRLQVGEILEADTSILQKSLWIQMQQLVIAPFLHSPNEINNTSHPRPTGPPIIIVIDAINECFGESRQLEIIHLVREAASHERLPILWIISSRPEAHICRSFDAIHTQIHPISISDIDRLLETQRPPSMFTYLRHRFNETYETRSTLTTCFCNIPTDRLVLCFKIFQVAVVLLVMKMLFFPRRSPRSIPATPKNFTLPAVAHS